jgi:hypothetical protein
LSCPTFPRRHTRYLLRVASAAVAYACSPTAARSASSGTDVSDADGPAGATGPSHLRPVGTVMADRRSQADPCIPVSPTDARYDTIRDERALSVALRPAGRYTATAAAAVAATAVVVLVAVIVVVARKDRPATDRPSKSRRRSFSSPGKEKEKGKKKSIIGTPRDARARDKDTEKFLSLLSPPLPPPPAGRPGEDPEVGASPSVDVGPLPPSLSPALTPPPPPRPPPTGTGFYEAVARDVIKRCRGGTLDKFGTRVLGFLRIFRVPRGIRVQSSRAESSRLWNFLAPFSPDALLRPPGRKMPDDSHASNARR